MKRTMFQLYLKGCDEAIELYKKAFDATVDAIYRNPENNTIAHAERRAFGQCIAFMERDSESVGGNTMQFCFHFGDGNEDIVKKAYEVLKVDAQIDFPLGSCEWSPCIFGLIDKFGVNWSLLFKCGMSDPAEDVLLMSEQNRKNCGYSLPLLCVR